MKIEKLTFDGTPEEFKEVAHIFAGQAGVALVGPAPVAEDASPEAIRAFIRRLLTRRHIPNGQLAIFQALYKAGDQGLTRAELAAATQRTEKKIDGVMGALGRRINNTRGIRQVQPGGGTGVLFEWRAVGNEMRYIMRPELRQVLEEMKIVPSPAA
jgi:hypothetical protein